MVTHDTVMGTQSKQRSNEYIAIRLGSIRDSAVCHQDNEVVTAEQRDQPKNLHESSVINKNCECNVLQNE